MGLFRRNEIGEPVNLLVVVSFCATMAIGAGFCYLGFLQSRLLGYLCLVVCLWGWQLGYDLVAGLLCPPRRDTGSAVADSRAGVSDPSMAQFIGRTGYAVTALRPSGYIMVDGFRHDAVSSGEFIEPGTSVLISAVRHKCLVVDRVAPGEG
jgi:membrane protein implicated in regulation of membrane protease activity